MLKIFVVQCHPRNIFNIELFPNYSTSLSLLHLSHHVTLSYMDRAMAAIISDVFQSHLVESIPVPSHLHEILVL